MADNDLLSKVTVALRRSDMPEELTQEVSDLVDAALAEEPDDTVVENRTA